MIVTRSSGPRPGVRAGIAVGLLGVALLVSAFGLEAHAAQASQLPPGEPIDITGTNPVHVVGLVEPGDDAQSPTTCASISTAGADPETIEIGTGQGVLSTIPAGQRLRAGGGRQLTLVCDQRVAVSTGPLVLAYPLAGSAILYPTYVLIALLGFGYARRNSRSPMAARPPVLPGDDARRSALKRYTADVVLGVVRTTIALAALLLGIVGLLALAQGSFTGGLAILAPAGVLGSVALLISRRHRSDRTE